MKNIKNIIIGIFAFIGVLVIITGLTNNTVQNDAGTYQIIIESTDSGWGTLYRLNTKTGEIKKIKQSTIEKIELK